MPPKRKLEVESYKFISRGYRRCGGKNDYMFNDYLHEPLSPRLFCGLCSGEISDSLLSGLRLHQPSFEGSPKFMASAILSKRPKYQEIASSEHSSSSAFSSYTHLDILRH
jgi:hypothetical protein